MKKIICFWLALLLCTFALGTFSMAEAEYTYLAITSPYSETEAVPGIPEGVEDTSRIIQVALYGANPPLPLRLPEGSGAPEDFSFVGILVAFDTPLDVSLEQQNNRLVNPPEGVLEPKRVEIIGPVQYGIIVEIGEDYVVLDAYDEFFQLTGDHHRYAITPDTLMLYESPFEAGSGCMIVVDQEGAAVFMDESNG